MPLTKDETLALWRQTRNLTRRTVESMPEDHGDFAPWDGAMSFSGLARHILSSEKALIQFLREGGTTFQWDQGITQEACPTLASVRRLLDEATQEDEAFLASLSEEEMSRPRTVDWGTVSAAQLLEDWQRHEIHHRGQMYVYLRLKEITPPNYE